MANQFGLIACKSAWPIKYVSYLLLPMAFKPHELPQRNHPSHCKPPLPTLELSFWSPAKAPTFSFPNHVSNFVYSRNTTENGIFPDYWWADRWNKDTKPREDLLNTHPSNYKRRRFPVRWASRDGALAEFWIICAAYQVPPSMGFSRQEYWSGLPLPSPIIETESSIDWKVVGCRGNHQSYTGSLEYGLFVLGLKIKLLEHRVAVIHKCVCVSHNRVWLFATP